VDHFPRHDPRRSSSAISQFLLALADFPQQFGSVPLPILPAYDQGEYAQGDQKHYVAAKGQLNTTLGQVPGSRTVNHQPAAQAHDE
jgi:hypothetical protein